ncbi:MAG: S-methyl-5'-thioadenosine phosphorylase [Polyangiaceae bacterium]
MAVLGIVGGSGLYDMTGLRDVERFDVDTPYGAPSDALVRARLDGTDHQLLFLPRHGRGHRVPPHAINYRANVCALKKAGATHLLSVSAVGSMKETIAPGDLVVVDQFIDLTKRRISTFFDAGSACHVAFAEPICPVLAEALHAAAERVVEALPPNGRPRIHRGGTYVCIEGPQFSTRAESLVYRSWGVDVVGMTNMPEAKLAREAQLPYATLALATDYDCWHESEEAVDVAAVIARLGTMVDHARNTSRELAASLPAAPSPAEQALAGALMTAPDAMPPEVRSRLSWLLPT